MKTLLIVIATTICFSAKSQTITHTYHLTDSLWIDSLTTVAVYKGVEIFRLSEATNKDDAEDLETYHYFLALIAFYKTKKWGYE
jgi:hypothetical protein